MGKTGKWIKNFLTGKKDKDREKNATVVVNGHPMTPVMTPQTASKEKKRWSFRRSSAAAPCQQALLESEDEQRKHAVAVAAAAADAAVAAAKAAAAVIQLTATSTATASGRATEDEEAAAIKIQSCYRGYLARKALNALKGLVKLQALVRGHLVRKQAAATLRCMQALITAQARARAQRLRVVEEPKFSNQRQSNHRKSRHENRSMPLYQEFARNIEEDVKIVEMDVCESRGSARNRNSCSIHTNMDRLDHLIATHPGVKQDHQQISVPASAITDFSPRACSAHFEDHSYCTAQSSPQHSSAISKPDSSRIPLDYARSEYADSLYNEYPFYPSYMANTQSSRAKVRSHSAPKQRPESFERQPSRRRQSLEGRNMPRGVRMLRSSSNAGSTGQNYQYPWSVKLDGSTVSLKDSECGSNITVLTNANYCRSLV